MIYKKPPNISKSAIKKAGDVLISNTDDNAKLENARTILNQWRACHAYPINTFQATLRKKAANEYLGEGAIIAQRLKRSSTILAKLRQLNVGLGNMQDIAGVRAILPSINDVYKLREDYEDPTRFKHKLCYINDYLQNPKSDGYRSIHLVYKYKNMAISYWDGLLIELQIRTKLQHSWATAVEAINTFLGKAIKTRQGQNADKDWTEFFALVSSAFAYIEGTPIVESHNQFSRKDILTKIKTLEKKLKVKSRLKALPRAFKQIYTDPESKKSYFHLLILNTKKRKIQIRSYGRDEIEKANEEYAMIEAESKGKEEIDPVLVSTTGGYLETAYASFFASTGDFYDNLENVLSGKWAGESTKKPHFLKRIISSIFHT